MTAKSPQECISHARHHPVPTYTELHHVIPQAWQAFWQPPSASPAWEHRGRSPDHRSPGGAPLLLFDARTVPLCRTGHGNVHHWIVLIMRAYAELKTIGAAEHEVRETARAAGVHVGTADFTTAALAPERWVEAGGSLDDLIARQLWGGI